MNVMDLVPDPKMLRVDLPAAGAFVADDAVSTCPLLTPSPPTNALVDPTSDPQEPSYIVRGDELATKLKQVEDEPNTVDSTSSNSSITAEPACVQLLNHHHYHHLTKNTEDGNMQENGIKQPPLQLTCGKADNFVFVNWNWPIIRKSCMWVFISGLIGCLALVIAMVATLPRTCNPPAEWYHGSLMYEIFPASFQDSNGDSIGDLKGLASRADYIKSLGVRAVRLNSIFQAPHYPEGYHNITSLTKIDNSLGTLMDFAILVNALHTRNISLILDLPIWPLVKQLHPAIQVIQAVNKTDLRSVEEFIHTNNFQQVTDTEIDTVAEAIDFWLEKGVDGFYIKGLENYLSSDHFGESIKKWKRMIGPERVLIINHEVLESAPGSVINILLNRVDLVDVMLDLESGTSSIRNQIESIHNSTLFTMPGAPWVHWSLGNVETRRLASRLVHGNATLGAILLQLMLPGTQNLFYGDEVGLQDISDLEGEREDLKHMHQLAAMVWDKKEKQFTRDVLAWMHGKPTNASFPQRKLITQMIKLRESSPAIYVNSIVKDGETKANAEVKYSEQDILIIQRWYQRRNSYVVVSNLGAEQFSADLSKMFYSGKVVIGPRADSVCESISFKHVMLWPGESVVIELY